MKSNVWVNQASISKQVTYTFSFIVKEGLFTFTFPFPIILGITTKRKTRIHPHTYKHTHHFWELGLWTVSHCIHISKIYLQCHSTSCLWKQHRHSGSSLGMFMLLTQLVGSRCIVCRVGQNGGVVCFNLHPRFTIRHKHTKVYKDTHACIHKFAHIDSHLHPCSCNMHLTRWTSPWAWNGIHLIER